jgi:S-adenosylmethionine hydrolase
MKRSVITLLTDFGLRDPFVGVMKGVILRICPDATVVDITHDVPPQAVGEAAFLLACAYPYFAAGTVHVAVVDPGVGGARRPIAARGHEQFFVGPDNGILTYPFAEAGTWHAVEIANPQYRLSPVSATFHGRDVFAPAAAHLAAGVALEALGPAITDPVLLEVPTPTDTPHGLEAHIIHADRFGNLITDLKQDRFAQWLSGETAGNVVIEAGSARLRGVSDSYDIVPAGRPLAIIGSTGRLEIAVSRGHAGNLLGLQAGDGILLRRAE